MRGAGLRPPPALLLLERGWERESVPGPSLAVETRVLAASRRYGAAECRLTLALKQSQAETLRRPGASSQG